MRRIRVFILISGVIALVLWRVLSQASEFRLVDTGKERLCLPVDQKGMFSTPPLFTRVIKDGDTPGGNASFLVTFEPERVGSRIPEYATNDSGEPAFLHARITNVGGEDAMDAALRGGPFAEGLQLRGDYIYAEKFPQRDAWRVSQLPFPDVLTWTVYTVKPSVDRDIPANIEDYFLGQCIVQTREQRQCYQVTQVDGYHVRFELNEVNLFLKDKLRAFLSDQFLAWRENCQGS